jgi:hypothetical protein
MLNDGSASLTSADTPKDCALDYGFAHGRVKHQAKKKTIYRKTLRYAKAARRASLDKRRKSAIFAKAPFGPKCGASSNQ